MRAHGVLDSLTFEDLPSFLATRTRHDCRAVLDKMLESARCVISHITLDNCSFNIEYFFDVENKHIALLKINPRILQSRDEIFRKGDGNTNLKIIIDLAFRQPEFSHGLGEFLAATKFYLRCFKDGLVKRAPSRAEIEGFKREIPDAVIDIRVAKSIWLSELMEQDSYSDAPAIVCLGAQDHDALMAKYHRMRAALRFDIAASHLLAQRDTRGNLHAGFT